MLKFKRKNRDAAEGEVHRDTEIELIKSLFGNRNTLIVGVGTHITVCTVSYFNTGDTRFLWIMLFIVGAFLFRMHGMYEFEQALKRTPKMSYPQMKGWERSYILGGGLTSGGIGTLAAFAMYVYPSSLPAFLTIALAAAIHTSVVGRNFGSARNVEIIVLLVTLPPAIACFALALQGDWWYLAIAVMLLPIMSSTRQLAEFVRGLLQQSNEQLRAKELVASQFDSATNNMPNGLIMVSSDGITRLVNNKTVELLGIRDKADVVERHVRHLVRIMLKRRQQNGQETQQMKEAIKTLLRGTSTPIIIEGTDGRYLEFSSKRISHTPKHGESRLAWFEGVVVTFEDVTLRHEKEMEAWRLARFDGLSEIPNRRHMEELVQHAVANLKDDEVFAFSIFDVDRFKLINDTMGHHAGDQLIVAIANKLKAIDDPRKIIARLGGDEYVLAFTGLSKDENVEELFHEAFSNICGTYRLDGQLKDVRVSGGVTIHTREGFTLDKALAKADAALYKTKKSPIDAFSIFSSEMEAEFQRTLAMKQALKDAIKDDAFHIMYQPMYTPDGASFKCCEALARWDHPELGEIKPSEFIKIAEDMGAIHQLTKRIVARACHDCASWESGTSVSVNLSAIDLQHPDLVPMIMRCVTEANLDPKRLHIEVTETVFVQDFDATFLKLKQLGDMGVRIAIDDFGTGYSSLSYLHKLPLNTVKIDRSFITNLGSDAQSEKLFNGIVRLSKELNFEIIVEGVETADQLTRIMATTPVDYVQGYFYAAPLATAGVMERQLLDAGRRDTSVQMVDFTKRSQGKGR